MNNTPGNFIISNTDEMKSIRCAQAQIVFYWLCKFRNHTTGLCFPTYDKLSECCCLSESSIRRAIKYLISIKKIKIKENSGRSNHYIILNKGYPCQIEQGIGINLMERTETNALMSNAIVDLEGTPVTQTPLSNRHPCLIDTPVTQTPTPVTGNTLSVPCEQLNRLIKKNINKKDNNNPLTPLSGGDAEVPKTESKKSSGSSFLNSQKLEAKKSRLDKIAEWKKFVDIEPLKKYGFDPINLFQIIDKTKLTKEEVNESIKNCAETLNQPGKLESITSTPLLYFLGHTFKNEVFSPIGKTGKEIVAEEKAKQKEKWELQKKEIDEVSLKNANKRFEDFKQDKLINQARAI